MFFYLQHEQSYAILTRDKVERQSCYEIAGVTLVSGLGLGLGHGDRRSGRSVSFGDDRRNFGVVAVQFRHSVASEE